MRLALCTLMIVCVASGMLAAAEEWPPAIEPLVRSVDLNVGESCDVTLCDGSTAAVKLVDLQETRDNVRQAVREAHVTVEVNGQPATLTSATYRLPVEVGGVQIDCAVTKGCVQGKENRWALQKDARLRLWPAGSPWVRPGAFIYPVNQRWFANFTEMANEPSYVDCGEDPAAKPIYYHWGLDIGGTEGLVEVASATDGVVITAGLESVNMPDCPASLQHTLEPYSDTVCVRDGRGWILRYIHLQSIDPAMKPGARVKMGQKVGVLGKEGESGGWSHLHFDITALQPSGEYGILEGYAFLWQAYHEQHRSELQAVARPHHLLWAGESVTLDGSRSWSVQGPEHIASYQWLLSDGTQSEGSKLVRRYERPGEYSEILKVTDADGRVDYDIAIVLVMDREHPKPLPPRIHAVYWPTFDLKAGNDVTFKVRSFGIGRTEGHERWDFGDGSPPVEVQSDGNADPHAKDGYAITKHRYAKAGDYLVSVSRTNDRGETATARLHLHIQ
jgi:murein DD-endopeptidase MepM/ murein hydrolase activator NlpD